MPNYTVYYVYADIHNTRKCKRKNKTNFTEEVWGSRKYPECETSTEVNFQNLQFLFTSACDESKMRAYNEFITYVNVEIYDVVKRSFER